LYGVGVWCDKIPGRQTGAVDSVFLG
jgi:hypothetical protein